MRSTLCQALLVAALVPAIGAAQAPRDSLVVRGRVTDEGGHPLAGATVTLAPTFPETSHSAVTDSQGFYRLVVPIVVPITSGEDSLHILALGYAPTHRVLQRPAGETTIVFDVQMHSASPTLERLVTRGERPRPIHDANLRASTPGATQQTLDLQNGLSGNLSGDIASALAMVPGVLAAPGVAGTIAPSAFGLSSELNGSTLNGSAFGGTHLPRDGLRQTVRLATYDPKEGRFAGLQVSANLPSGTGYRDRMLHLTVDHPILQFSSPGRTATPRFQDHVLSGRFSGPLTGQRFYNAAFQVGEVLQATETLGSVDRATLDLLGVHADSLSRTLAVARALGLPVGEEPGQASVTSASAIARIDLTNGAGPLLDTREPVVYLLGSAATSIARRQGLSALALPSRSMHTTRHEGQLVAVYAPYLFSALSETKLSLAAREVRSSPDDQLPGVTVLLASAQPGGTTQLTPLALGGTGTLGQTTRLWRAQGSNLTSWTTWDRVHTFELYADASVEKGSWRDAGTTLGTFTFNSARDFADARPARFDRTLSGVQSSASVLRTTFALSDVITVGKEARAVGFSSDEEGLRLQLGLRIDADRFDNPPRYNRVIDSLFGRRNDERPNSIAASPMLGFTWNRGVYQVFSGPVVFTDVRNAISGGIRLYRGTVSLEDFDDVRRRSGVAADGLLDLECVGPAAPTPSWSTYLADPSSIPDQCAEPSATPTSQIAPSVAFYPPNFQPPRSLRGELNWRWLMSGHLYGFVRGTIALNRGNVVPYDLNLGETPEVILGNESSRPVFAAKDAISPVTGQSPLSASRRSSMLGSVVELRPGLSSHVRQLTGGVEYRIGASRFLSPEAPDPPRFTAILRASYTNARGRAQVNGFNGTTAGDPRRISWSPMLVPRHTIQLRVDGQVDGWFSVSAAALLNSGIPYTPVVAGDVNGDGFRNDRSFVFMPGADGAIDVDSGMVWLLRNAPHSARRCLQRQLGTIAAQGSCAGSWTASVGTIALTVDAYRLGLGNRGSLTIFANNALAGFDALLHGSRRQHGWGSGGTADATLLAIRGFDAAEQRYQYTVNPHFGRRDIGSLSRAPFRLTLDFRLDVGPDRESQFIRARMIDAARLARTPSPTPDDVKILLLSLAEPSAGRDFQKVIDAADSLALSPMQRDSIESMIATYQAARDSIYGDLASRLVALNGRYDGEGVRSVWHRAIVASIEARYDVVSRVRALLTPVQLRWLQVHGIAPSLNYSEAWLRRLTRGPLFPQ